MDELDPACEPDDDLTIQAKEDDPLVALFIETGFSEKVRYDHLRQQWYYWNKPRWRVDKTKHVYDMIRQHTYRLLKTAGRDEQVIKMLTPLLNWNKKETFLKSLSARSEVAMEGTEWDADPYLLGFNNGIVDLRTGEFDPNPGPEVLVSKSVGCDWDPDASYDTFNAFMASIFPDDPAVLQYVYTLLGYSLFGLQREQKFWMWTGRGSNGKGILARTMVHVLGDYAETPSDSLYMKTKAGVASSSQARPDLVRLQGARFTFMSEPPGKQFNEELLKAHTGEDTIIARDLYSKAAQFAQFTPTHKIIFLTNEPPQTEDVGISMRRRARMVRFEEDFTGDRADMKIEDRVKAEKQGILVALVSLARYWYENGLTEPPAVTQWSEEYISDNDPLAAWVTDNCDLLSGERTSSSVLYADYQNWCAVRGAEARSQTAFSTMLAKRFRKEKTRSGAQFVGIRLKPIEQRAEDEEEGDD